MVPVRANGQPAWGEYVRDPITGRLHVVGVLVVGLAGDRTIARSPTSRRRSRRTSACPGRSTKRFAMEGGRSSHNVLLQVAGGREHP